MPKITPYQHSEFESRATSTRLNNPIEEPAYLMLRAMESEPVACRSRPVGLGVHGVFDQQSESLDMSPRRCNWQVVGRITAFMLRLQYADGS